MKRSKQCPKCQSLRVGYLAAQADADDSFHSEGKHFSRAEEATNRPVGHSDQIVETGFWAFGDVRLLLGELEAYVCVDCGYHESYVKSPESLEWESLRGFSWVNPPQSGDGPYR